MKQNDYIRGQVAEFVTWMSRRLDDDTFKHAYTSRRTGTHWACENLFDAYERYHWTYGDLSGYGIPAGSSFDSSLHALETLQKELNAGLAVGNNERVHRAAIGVMIWGGVTNGNRKWLNDHKNELCHIISRTRDAINAGDTENPLLADGDLRFTSGMSKVYSLVCDDFVIYDSRVAAALGRAVVQFCQAQGQAKGQAQSLTELPEGLDLAWAPAKSAPNAINPPERCAGQARLTFPRLASGRVYVKWNMLASWLLTAIADHECARSSAFVTRIESRTQRLRALEAALFMVGYDLGGDSDAGGRATRRHEPVGPQTRGRRSERRMNGLNVRRGSEGVNSSIASGRMPSIPGNRVVGASSVFRIPKLTKPFGDWQPISARARFRCPIARRASVRKQCLSAWVPLTLRRPEKTRRMRAAWRPCSKTSAYSNQRR